MMVNPLQQPMLGGQMVVPGQLVAPGQMAMSSGMQQLAVMPGLQVQEKARWLQEATAMMGMEVEMSNKYRVLDQVGNQLFYAAEKTDCCRRQFQQGCLRDCISWEVDVLYTPPGQLMQKFLALRRPFSCVCCCFNRPTMDVIEEQTGAKIGSFRDPCTCCALQFQIRDNIDMDVLVVNGGHVCTQPGMMCPLPCGPCREVKFKVEDAQTGGTVAHITKRVPSCFTWLFAPDVDNYHVTFDQIQNPQWKAILLAFTIFMDFRYFNDNRNEQKAQQDAWQAQQGAWQVGQS